MCALMMHSMLYLRNTIIEEACEMHNGCPSDLACLLIPGRCFPTSFHAIIVADIVDVVQRRYLKALRYFADFQV